MMAVLNLLLSDVIVMLGERVGGSIEMLTRLLDTFRDL